MKTLVTPHEEYTELAQALTIPRLFFKREDKHPLGSHKGRSLPVMIDGYVKNGVRSFALSSSGNASIAAARYIHNYNEKNPESPLELTMLVGEHINKDKLAKLNELKSESIRLMMVERPLQSLFSLTKAGDMQGLRQSTDDSALSGYEELVDELLEIPDLSDIFIAASSGTTAQALAQFLLEKKADVAVTIVQTLSCHPLADAFVETPENNEKSFADAIVDITAHRKDTLTPLIEKTGGTAYVASNEIIESAQSLIKKHTGANLTANGALPVAGLMEANYAGFSPRGTVVCIICGA